MMVLSLILTLLLSACSLVLLQRIRRLGLVVEAPATRDGLAACLQDYLAHHGVEGVLSRAGAGGLADIDLPYREANDAARNAAELWQQILALANADNLSDLTELVELLYQFQYAVAAPSDSLDPCLRPLVNRLQAASFMNRPVGTICLVSVGQSGRRQDHVPHECRLASEAASRRGRS